MTSPSEWPNLEALFDDEGQVTVGAIQPLPCVAVASDQHTMLAALQRRAGESLIDLLNRLDAAVENAHEHQIFIDEINSGP